MPDDTVAATTTAEQDRHALGQRRTNILWEVTQSLIAICVVLTVLYVNARVALTFGAPGTPDVPHDSASSSGLMQLNVVGALVIGFYFGRTNHQRVGGIGGEVAGAR
jgi:hypothetical protein